MNTLGAGTRSKDSDRLFCIVRHWPADGRMHVPVRAPVRGAHLLGGGGTPTVKTGAAGFTLDRAGIEPPDKNASGVVLEVEGGMNMVNATSSDGTH